MTKADPNPITKSTLMATKEEPEPQTMTFHKTSKKSADVPIAKQGLT
jgi:hypothetical protein